jgi:hypothetical protein
MHLLRLLTKVNLYFSEGGVCGAPPHTPLKPFLQKGFENPKKLGTKKFLFSIPKSKKSIIPYSPKVFERGLGKTFSKKFSPASSPHNQMG